MNFSSFPSTVLSYTFSESFPIAMTAEEKKIPAKGILGPKLCNLGNNYITGASIYIIVTPIFSRAIKLKAKLSKRQVFFFPSAFFQAGLDCWRGKANVWGIHGC
jgi:hypothetical protein